MHFKSKTTLFFRCVAIIVTLLFTGETVLWSAPDPYRLQIPERIGKIKERWIPKIVNSPQSIVDRIKHFSMDYGLSSMDLPFIIHVQDAHTSLDAQKHIAEIISYLSKNNDLNLIGLEGATEALDMKALRDFPVYEAKRNVAWDYVQEGKFTGAEYQGIVSQEPLDLIGIENEKLFLNNLKSYRFIHQYQRPVINIIDSVERQIDVAKSRLFSSELLEWTEQVDSFSENEKNITGFISQLFRESQKQEVDLEDYPQLLLLHEILTLESEIDLKKTQQELMTWRKQVRRQLSNDAASRQRLAVYSHQWRRKEVSEAAYWQFVQELARSVHRPFFNENKFNTFSRRLALIAQLDTAALINNVRELAYTLSLKLAQTKEEKQILTLLRQLHISKQLVKLESVEQDVTYYETFKLELQWEALHRTLQSLHLQPILSETIHHDQWNQVLDTISTFYSVVEKRNEALIQNLLKRMKQKKQRVALLVSGGFHTTGLTRIMKERRIPYAVIQPTLNQHDVTVPAATRLIGQYAGIQTTQFSHFNALLHKVLSPEEYDRFMSSYKTDLTAEAVALRRVEAIIQKWPAEHQQQALRWVQDKLPDLKKIRRLSARERRRRVRDILKDVDDLPNPTEFKRGLNGLLGVMKGYGVQRINQLFNELRTGSDEEKIKAARKLGQMTTQRPTIAEGLKEVLFKRNNLRPVEKAIVEALRAIGSSNAEFALLKYGLMVAYDRAMKAYMVDIFNSREWPVPPPMFFVRFLGNPQISSAAESIIDGFGEQAAGALRLAIANPNSEPRLVAKALFYLAKLEDPEDEELFASQIHHEDDRVRFQAILGLNVLGAKQYGSELVAMLQTPAGTERLTLDAIRHYVVRFPTDATVADLETMTESTDILPAPVLEAVHSALSEIHRERVRSAIFDDREIHNFIAPLRFTTDESFQWRFLEAHTSDLFHIDDTTHRNIGKEDVQQLKGILADMRDRSEEGQALTVTWLGKQKTFQPIRFHAGPEEEMLEWYVDRELLEKTPYSEVVIRESIQEALALLKLKKGRAQTINRRIVVNVDAGPALMRSYSQEGDGVMTVNGLMISRIYSQDDVLGKVLFSTGIYTALLHQGGKYTKGRLDIMAFERVRQLLEREMLSRGTLEMEGFQRFMQTVYRMGIRSEFISWYNLLRAIVHQEATFMDELERVVERELAREMAGEDGKIPPDQREAIVSTLQNSLKQLFDLFDSVLSPSLPLSQRMANLRSFLSSAPVFWGLGILTMIMDLDKQSIQERQMYPEMARLALDLGRKADSSLEVGLVVVQLKALKQKTAATEPIEGIDASIAEMEERLRVLKEREDAEHRPAEVRPIRPTEREPDDDDDGEKHLQLFIENDLYISRSDEDMIGSLVLNKNKIKKNLEEALKADPEATEITIQVQLNRNWETTRKFYVQRFKVGMMPRYFFLDETLVQGFKKIPEEMTALMIDALTDTGRGIGPDSLDGTIVMQVDQSHGLASDHQQNHFVGVNKILSDVIRRHDADLAELLLQVAVLHEVSHEAGFMDERRLSILDAAYFISRAEQRGLGAFMQRWVNYLKLNFASNSPLLHEMTIKILSGLEGDGVTRIGSSHRLVGETRDKPVPLRESNGEKLNVRAAFKLSDMLRRHRGLIRRLLKSHQANFRKTAATEIREKELSELQDFLIVALEDESPEVRREAIATIQGLHLVHALPHLRRLLTRETDEETQVIVLEAMDELERPRTKASVVHIGGRRERGASIIEMSFWIMGMVLIGTAALADTGQAAPVQSLPYGWIALISVVVMLVFISRTERVRNYVRGLAILYGLKQKEKEFDLWPQEQKILLFDMILFYQSIRSGKNAKIEADGKNLRQATQLLARYEVKQFLGQFKLHFSKATEIVKLLKTLRQQFDAFTKPFEAFVTGKVGVTYEDVRRLAEGIAETLEVLQQARASWLNASESLEERVDTFVDTPIYFDAIKKAIDGFRFIAVDDTTRDDIWSDILKIRNEYLSPDEVSRGLSQIKVRLKRRVSSLQLFEAELGMLTEILEGYREQLEQHKPQPAPEPEQGPEPEEETRPEPEQPSEPESRPAQAEQPQPEEPLAVPDEAPEPAPAPAEQPALEEDATDDIEIEVRSISFSWGWVFAGVIVGGVSAWVTYSLFSGTAPEAEAAKNTGQFLAWMGQNWIWVIAFVMIGVASIALGIWWFRRQHLKEARAGPGEDVASLIEEAVSGIGSGAVEEEPELSWWQRIRQKLANWQEERQQREQQRAQEKEQQAREQKFQGQLTDAENRLRNVVIKTRRLAQLIVETEAGEEKEGLEVLFDQQSSQIESLTTQIVEEFTKQEGRIAYLRVQNLIEQLDEQLNDSEKKAEGRARVIEKLRQRMQAAIQDPELSLRSAEDLLGDFVRLREKTLGNTANPLTYAEQYRQKYAHIEEEADTERQNRHRILDNRDRAYDNLDNEEMQVVFAEVHRKKKETIDPLAQSYLEALNQVNQKRTATPEVVLRIDDLIRMVTDEVNEFQQESPEGSVAPSLVTLAGQLQAMLVDLAESERVAAKLKEQEGGAESQALPLETIEALAKAYGLPETSPWSYALERHDLISFGDRALSEEDVRAWFAAMQTVRNLAKTTQFRLEDDQSEELSLGPLNFYASQIKNGKTEAQLEEEFTELAKAQKARDQSKGDTGEKILEQALRVLIREHGLFQPNPHSVAFTEDDVLGMMSENLTIKKAEEIIQTMALIRTIARQTKYTIRDDNGGMTVATIRMWANKMLLQGMAVATIKAEFTRLAGEQPQLSPTPSNLSERLRSASGDREGMQKLAGGIREALRKKRQRGPKPTEDPEGGNGSMGAASAYDELVTELPNLIRQADALHADENIAGAIAQLRDVEAALQPFTEEDAGSSDAEAARMELSVVQARILEWELEIRSAGVAETVESMTGDGDREVGEHAKSVLDALLAIGEKVIDLTVQQRVDSDERVEISADLEIAEEDNQRLEADHRTLGAEKEVANQERKRVEQLLQGQIKDKESAFREAGTINREETEALDRLSAALAQEQRIRDTKREELSALKGQNDDIDREREANERTLKGLQADKQQRQEMLSHMRREQEAALMEKEAVRGTQASQDSELQERIDQANAELQRKMTALEEISTRIAAAERKKSETQSEFRSTRDAAALEQAQLEGEIEDWSQKLGVAANIGKSLKRDLETLSTERDDLKKANGTLRAKESASQRINSGHEKEVRLTEERLDRTKDDIGRIEKRIGELHSEIEGIESEIAESQRLQAEQVKTATRRLRPADTEQLRTVASALRAKLAQRRKEREPTATVDDEGGSTGASYIFDARAHDLNAIIREADTAAAEGRIEEAIAGLTTVADEIRPFAEEEGHGEIMQRRASGHLRALMARIEEWQVDILLTKIAEELERFAHWEDELNAAVAQLETRQGELTAEKMSLERVEKEIREGTWTIDDEERERMAEAWKALRPKLEQLQSEERRITEQIDRLDTEKEQFYQRALVIAEKAISASGEYYQLSQERVALSRQLRDLHQKNAILDNQNGTLRADIERFRSNIETARQTTTQEIDALDQRIDGLKRETERVKRDQIGTQSQLEETTREKEEVLRQLELERRREKTLRERITSLRQQMERERQSGSDLIAEHERVSTDLAGRISRTAEEIAQFERGNVDKESALGTLLEQLEKKQREYEAADGRLTQLQSEIEEIEHAIRRAQEAAADKQRELSERREQLSTSQQITIDENQAARELIEQTQSESGTLKNEQQGLNERLESLRSHGEQLHTQKRDLEGQLEEAESERYQRSRQHELLIINRDRLIAHRDDLRAGHEKWAAGRIKTVIPTPDVDDSGQSMGAGHPFDNKVPEWNATIRESDRQAAGGEYEAAIDLLQSVVAELREFALPSVIEPIRLKAQAHLKSVEARIAEWQSEQKLIHFTALLELQLQERAEFERLEQAYARDWAALERERASLKKNELERRQTELTEQGKALDALIAALNQRERESNLPGMMIEIAEHTTHMGADLRDRAHHALALLSELMSTQQQLRRAQSESQQQAVAHVQQQRQRTAVAAETLRREIADTRVWFDSVIAPFDAQRVPSALAERQEEIAKGYRLLAAGKESALQLAAHLQLIGKQLIDQQGSLVQRVGVFEAGRQQMRELLGQVEALATEEPWRQADLDALKRQEEEYRSAARNLLLVRLELYRQYAEAHTQSQGVDQMVRDSILQQRQIMGDYLINQIERAQVRLGEVLTVAEKHDLDVENLAVALTRIEQSSAEYNGFFVHMMTPLTRQKDELPDRQRQLKENLHKTTARLRLLRAQIVRYSRDAGFEREDVFSGILEIIGGFGQEAHAALGQQRKLKAEIDKYAQQMRLAEPTIQEFYAASTRLWTNPHSLDETANDVQGLIEKRRLLLEKINTIVRDPRIQNFKMRDHALTLLRHIERLEVEQLQMRLGALQKMRAQLENVERSHLLDSASDTEEQQIGETISFETLRERAKAFLEETEALSRHLQSFAEEREGWLSRLTELDERTTILIAAFKEEVRRRNVETEMAKLKSKQGALSVVEARMKQLLEQEASVLGKLEAARAEILRLTEEIEAKSTEHARQLDIVRAESAELRKAKAATEAQRRDLDQISANVARRQNELLGLDARKGDLEREISKLAARESALSGTVRALTVAGMRQAVGDAQPGTRAHDFLSASGDLTYFKLLAAQGGLGGGTFGFLSRSIGDAIAGYMMDHMVLTAQHEGKLFEIKYTQDERYSEKDKVAKWRIYVYKDSAKEPYACYIPNRPASAKLKINRMYSFDFYELKMVKGQGPRWTLAEKGRNYFRGTVGRLVYGDAVGEFRGKVLSEPQLAEVNYLSRELSALADELRTPVQPARLGQLINDLEGQPHRADMRRKLQAVSDRSTIGKVFEVQQELGAYIPMAATGVVLSHPNGNEDGVQQVITELASRKIQDVPFILDQGVLASEISELNRRNGHGGTRYSSDQVAMVFDARAGRPQLSFERDPEHDVLEDSREKTQLLAFAKNHKLPQLYYLRVTPFHSVELWKFTRVSEEGQYQVDQLVNIPHQSPIQLTSQGTRADVGPEIRNPYVDNFGSDIQKRLLAQLEQRQRDIQTAWDEERSAEVDTQGVFQPVLPETSAPIVYPEIQPGNVTSLAESVFFIQQQSGRNVWEEIEAARHMKLDSFEMTPDKVLVVPPVANTPEKNTFYILYFDALSQSAQDGEWKLLSVENGHVKEMSLVGINTRDRKIDLHQASISESTQRSRGFLGFGSVESKLTKLYEYFGLHRPDQRYASQSGFLVESGKNLHSVQTFGGRGLLIPTSVLHNDAQLFDDPNGYVRPDDEAAGETDRRQRVQVGMRTVEQFWEAFSRDWNAKHKETGLLNRFEVLGYLLSNDSQLVLSWYDHSSDLAEQQLSETERQELKEELIADRHDAAVLIFSTANQVVLTSAGVKSTVGEDGTDHEFVLRNQERDYGRQALFTYTDRAPVDQTDTITWVDFLLAFGDKEHRDERAPLFKATPKKQATWDTISDTVRAWLRRARSNGVTPETATAFLVALAVGMYAAGTVSLSMAGIGESLFGALQGLRELSGFLSVPTFIGALIARYRISMRQRQAAAGNRSSDPIIVPAPKRVPIYALVEEGAVNRFLNGKAQLYYGDDFWRQLLREQVNQVSNQLQELGQEDFEIVPHIQLYSADQFDAALTQIHAQQRSEQGGINNQNIFVIESVVDAAQGEKRVDHLVGQGFDAQWIRLLVKAELPEDAVTRTEIQLTADFEDEFIALAQAYLQSVAQPEASHLPVDGLFASSVVPAVTVEMTNTLQSALSDQRLQIFLQQAA